MNPSTNEFELMKLIEREGVPRLIRPNGDLVPQHWSIFADDELVVIKGYTFKVAHIGKDYIVFEPVGPLVIGGKENQVTGG
jgi:hypothetical protein